MQPGDYAADDPAGRVVLTSANHLDKRAGSGGALKEQRSAMVGEDPSGAFAFPPHHHCAATRLFRLGRDFEHRRLVATADR
jgi:hypothetical protein